ncbi:iron ABC transporter permease [Sutterella sp.]|uniref:FecCD family ABC transporter permease n=1 Tax=Sutterella sp. TaxID=1981025 RepID=UPI0026DFBAD2|nr:iron ABC transporter permease [Sutterella sp.]MDO5532224.1 iron ABC transporter permease [Sutterella sp.]
MSAPELSSSFDEARARGRRFALALAGLVLVTLGVAVLSLFAGRYGLSAADTLGALLNPDAKTPAASILWNVRLPRIALALVAGAGLAASGAAFQALFANPLASPDTLGVATGSSFGAVLAILLGLGSAGIQGCAVVAGLVAIALVMMVSRVRPGGDQTGSILMIVLSGMVVGALFTALVSLVKFAADPQDVLPSITFWLMGSLTGATVTSLLSGLPLLIAGGAILLALSWRLNAAALPPDEAASLGINVRLLRGAVILAATLLTASVVSLCGLIGWVGLLVPHAARFLFGAANERVLPASMVLGALFLLVIDTAARTMAESEIPVSILTALVGAPVFIWLMRRSSGRF